MVLVRPWRLNDDGEGAGGGDDGGGTSTSAWTAYGSPLARGPHRAEPGRDQGEEQEKLEQVFPELRSPCGGGPRTRPSAPAIADDEVIVPDPGLTRLFVSQRETQILEEIEWRNQAIRQRQARVVVPL
uniref:Uncharacterized protein n=1 Tax=Oryza sativa subsp. japonica TaxID=39947 RepID=Q6ZF42_ORYSJ|nr:hypothetical protein [Oryza sativa Japonica Group]